MREEILAIVNDEKRVITDNIETKYLSDNLGRKMGTAAAVVFPVSTEEVSGLLKYAYDNAISVTPRGAGTNLPRCPRRCGGSPWGCSRARRCCRPCHG